MTQRPTDCPPGPAPLPRRSAKQAPWPAEAADGTVLRPLVTRRGRGSLSNASGRFEANSGNSSTTAGTTWTAGRSRRRSGPV